MIDMPSYSHIVCLAPALLGPVPNTLAQAVGTTPRPNLEWLLQRANPIQCQASGSEGLLAERFPPLPAAGPLIAAAPGLTDKSYCYRAAPIHLRADRDRLLVFAGQDCFLNEAESQSICDAVNAAFKDDGILLVAHGSEWLLFVDTPPGPELPPLSRLAGRYLDTVIPMDAAAKRWRQLLNEIQMLLHTHPVNQAREAAGLLVVNGLWAWGGGAIQVDSPKALLRENWLFEGDSALVKGANALMRGADQPTNQYVWLYEAAEQALMGGDAGAWLTAIDWFEENYAKQWVEQCKVAGATVELRVGDGMGWQIDKGSKWRFWRRKHSLRSFIKVKD